MRRALSVLVFVLCHALAGQVHAATADSSSSSSNGTTEFITRCPVGAECRDGAVVAILEGYWRSSPTSSQVHKCPRYESCEAGGVCAPGYTGNLCGAAAPGYGLNRPFTVARCMSTASSVAVFVSGLLVLFVAICWMVMSTLADNARCIAEAKMPLSADPACTCPFRCGFVGVVIRHIQHTMIINVGLMTWPSGLRALFASATWFLSVAGLSNQMGSLSCWFILGAASKVPWAMLKLLAGLITPLVMCVAVVAAVLALRLGLLRLGLNSERRRTNIFTVLARASGLDVGMVGGLIIVFFFWPSLVYASLSIFACCPIDRPGDPGAVATAGRGYWVMDIQQPCFAGWHRTWTLALGLPAALIVLSMPFQVAGGFLLHKAKLQTDEFKSVVGFMYHNYRPTAFFWEPVNAIELAVVVAVHCFSHTLGPYYSMLLLNISFALFLLLQIACHPHAYKELHQLQVTSLGLLFFTTYLCLTVLPQSAGSAAAAAAAQPLQLYGNVVGVLGLVMNAAFVAWGFWEICRMSRVKVMLAWGMLLSCCGQPACSKATA